VSQLKKEITLWRGLVLAVSMLIGSGLLGLPGLALDVGNAHDAAGGWMLICIAIAPIVYVFSRLGLKYASAAGLSKYAEEAVGEWGGYAVTTIALGTHTFGIPTVGLIAGSFVQNLFDLPAPSVSIIAIIILSVATAANLSGIKTASFVNTASFSVLIVMLIMVIGFNHSFFSSGFMIFSETLTGSGDVSYTGIWATSALIFWAFLGWENLSFGLEEFRNPKQTIPLVYGVCYAFVVLLYLTLAITSIGADISGVSVRGASGLASLLQFVPFGNALTVIVIIVIVANISSWAFGFSRLIYSAGRSGILPAYLGKLNRNSVPANSLISLYFFYTCIILFQHFSPWLSISTLMMLANQNFVVLYIISVFAFWKTEKGVSRWIGSLLAFASCGFLLSGFTWRIIYPAVLISIGYTNYWLRKGKGKSPSDQ